MFLMNTLLPLQLATGDVELLKVIQCSKVSRSACSRHHAVLLIIDISIFLTSRWPVKALIQMMAASVAQRDLAYFTFDNEKQAKELQSMYRFLKCQKMTVGE